MRFALFVGHVLLGGCGLVGFEDGDASPAMDAIVDDAGLDAGAADAPVDGSLGDSGADTPFVVFRDANTDALVDAVADAAIRDAGIPRAMGFGGDFRVLDIVATDLGFVLVGDRAGDAYVFYCTFTECDRAVSAGVAGASPTETMAAVAATSDRVYAVGATRVSDAAILFQSAVDGAGALAMVRDHDEDALVLRDVAADDVGFAAVGAIVGAGDVSSGLVLVGVAAAEVAFRITAPITMDFTNVVLDGTTLCVSGHSPEAGENVVGCFNRSDMSPIWFRQIEGRAPPPTSLTLDETRSELWMAGQRLTRLQAATGVDVGALEFPGLDITGAHVGATTEYIARDADTGQFLIIAEGGARFRSGLAHGRGAFTAIGDVIYGAGSSTARTDISHILPFEAGASDTCWGAEAALAPASPATASVNLAVNVSPLLLSAAMAASGLSALGPASNVCP